MSGLPSSPQIDLPGPSEPIINPDGTVTPIWYRYFTSSILGAHATPTITDFILSLASILGITSLQQGLTDVQDQLTSIEDTALLNLLADLQNTVSRLEPRWPAEELILGIISSSSFSSVQVYGEITGGIQPSQTIWRWVSSQNVVFRGKLHGSDATCGVQATADSIFSIQKNGVQFATMTFPAATTPATFTGAKTLFLSGDVLTIVAPNPVDTTLEGLSWNFVAKHSQFA